MLPTHAYFGNESGFKRRKCALGECLTTVPYDAIKEDYHSESVPANLLAMGNAQKLKINAILCASMGSFPIRGGKTPKFKQGDIVRVPCNRFTNYGYGTEGEMEMLVVSNDHANLFLVT